jgi:hypothetical protein
MPVDAQAQNFPKKIKQANDLFLNKKYDEASFIFKSIISSQTDDLVAAYSRVSSSLFLYQIYSTHDDINKRDSSVALSYLNTANKFCEKLMIDYPGNNDQTDALIEYIKLEKEKLFHSNPKLFNTGFDNSISKQDLNSQENAIDKTKLISTDNRHSNNLVNLDSSDRIVNLTVNGFGKNVDEAKRNALRNACEQAFGVFISTKTEIKNDQVLSEDIISFSSGNIHAFNILLQSQLPDSTWALTLSVDVSLNSMVSFVKSKGVDSEFKGGLFALNIKQQNLREQNESRLIYDMIGLIHEYMQNAFDYIITSKEPRSLDNINKNWEIPLEITATANKNSVFCASYFIDILKSLSLTSEEVKLYKNLNKSVFSIKVIYGSNKHDFYLRSKNSVNAIHTLLYNWEFYIRLFNVSSGFDEFSGMNDSSRIVGATKHGFSNIKDFGSDASLNFLTLNETAATFLLLDKKTLDQIEKISKYSIKPIDLLSSFKHGGFVVYEKDGHGLVASMFDINDQVSLSDAQKITQEVSFGGYKDWKIPTLDQYNLIKNNLYKNGISFFKTSYQGSFDERTYFTYLGLPEKNSTYGNRFSFILTDYLGEIENPNSQFFLRLIRVY